MPTYQHLSGEDEDVEHELASSQPRVPLLSHGVIRPQTYYGEGPFDAPSSDDDDDDVYLVKEAREQGGLHDSDPDNGLRVGGGRQVRRSVCTRCNV